MTGILASETHFYKYTYSESCSIAHHYKVLAINNNCTYLRQVPPYICCMFFCLDISNFLHIIYRSSYRLLFGQVLWHRGRVCLTERLAGVNAYQLLVVPAMCLEVEETPSAGQRMCCLVAVRKERIRGDVVHFVVVLQSTCYLWPCTRMYTCTSTFRQFALERAAASTTEISAKNDCGR